MRQSLPLRYPDEAVPPGPLHPAGALRLLHQEGNEVSVLLVMLGCGEVVRVVVVVGREVDA